MDKPALMVGALSLGTKCVKLMGLAIEGSRYRVRQTEKNPEPQPGQFNLFDDAKLQNLL